MGNKGILLPISSLDTQFGIGDLGPSAYRFADFLAANQQTFWQILPITYCGYGNSPYNPLSSLLGNPYLISPEFLLRDGLISQKELNNAMLPCSDTIDYSNVYKAKDALFDIAISHYLMEHDIQPFIDRNADVLKPAMAFLTLRELYGDSSWFTWDGLHRRYSEDLYRDLMHKFSFFMLRAAVLQAIFEAQMTELKTYLNSHGILLFGDIPLYVAYDSADVWANPEYFSLTEHGERINVAGVPPDAFSDEGQLWGNPIYLWDKMRETNYEWFVRRIGKTIQYFDLLRLDHFIGYVNYWQIPASDTTAINGAWIDGPATDLFDVLCDTFGKEVFIAEDLGILSDKVCHVRDHYGLPGMIILHFCFDDQIPQTEQFPWNKIIYTGTHDNQTTRGWFLEALKTKPATIINLARYLLQRGQIQKPEELTASNISLLLIASAYNSPCKTAIIPFQDILGLDDTARCNIPGTPEGNWGWRMEATAYDSPTLQEWTLLSQNYNH